MTPLRKPRSFDEPAVISAPSPWLFAFVYAVHLVDEGGVAGGLPAWATAHGYLFTLRHWLWVSSISLLLFSTSVWLVSRHTWPSWVLVAESASHGVLVAAITNDGEREWMFYVADDGGTTSRLVHEVPQQEERYPIRLERSREPRWDSFRKLLEGMH